MTRMPIVALLLGTLASSLLAQQSRAQQSSVMGTWLTASGVAQVRISPCADPASGPVCGVIVGLINPKGPNGQVVAPEAAVDYRNPDPALRTRKVIGLPLHVSGIAPLGHFAFDLPDAQEVRTLFTQMMLDRGILATGSFYAMWAHTDAHVDRYLEILTEVFRELRAAIDQKAVRHERGVDAGQDVDHVLRLDASERPAAERDVEALALDVQRFRAVHTETDAGPDGARAFDTLPGWLSAQRASGGAGLPKPVQALVKLDPAKASNLQDFTVIAILYGGLVRQKNTLAIMMQSFALMALITVLWAVVGYSLCFGEGTPIIGEEPEAAAVQPACRPMTSRVKTWVEVRHIDATSNAASRREVARYFASEPNPGEQSVIGRSLSTVLVIPTHTIGYAKLAAI